MKPSREELKRYSRQILLPEFGLAGQARLKTASVLVVGAGGLGSPVALYLAAAGVGRLGICEFDQLEVHNLQRQIIYSSDQLGGPKLEAAIGRLRALNPLVTLEGLPKLTAENAAQSMAGFDLIVDATDTFASRYLVADTCVALGLPWVWGAAQGWEGMVSVFDTSFGLRDAFPEAPEEQDNCDTIGVIGPLLGVVGGMMATEAIKHLVGLETLHGRLWTFDALSSQVRVVKLQQAKPTL